MSGTEGVRMRGASHGRVIACWAGGDLCCMDDPEDPCFQPIIGPKQRRIPIRYSARFVGQVRELSGDRRWPLRIADDLVHSERDRVPSS